MVNDTSGVYLVITKQTVSFLTDIYFLAISTSISFQLNELLFNSQYILLDPNLEKFTEAYKNDRMNEYKKKQFYYGWYIHIYVYVPSGDVHACR